MVTLFYFQVVIRVHNIVREFSIILVVSTRYVCEIALFMSYSSHRASVRLTSRVHTRDTVDY